MKIFRYLVLLLGLFALGTAVFIATQKPNYSVTRSLVIKNPRSVVFDYVDNYRNWETFAAWILEQNGTNFDYPGNASGKGAEVHWSGDRNGSLKTIGYKTQTTLYQVMEEAGNTTIFHWQFKDTLGGTKVTYRIQGKLDFKSKAAAFFKGGVQSTMAALYERTLTNLSKTLDKEINTFSINVGEAVNRPRIMCLKQYARCSEKEVTRTIKSLLPRMQLFFKRNKIAASGKPFIVYHQFDRVQHQVALSVCMPVRDSIHIMEGSDITFLVYPPHKALKVTLKGDYSHTQKAWQKGFNFIYAKKWLRLTHLNITEVYRKSMAETPHPSQWETDVYIPVQPLTLQRERLVVNDSTATQTTNQPIPEEN
jgi:effector-binding domain-containing protein